MRQADTHSPIHTICLCLSPFSLHPLCPWDPTPFPPLPSPPRPNRWRKGKGCPGAEDPTAVRNRIAKGLDEIERDHRGEQVIVVTHGGILNSIHKLITGTKFPGKIPNTR